MAMANMLGWVLDLGEGGGEREGEMYLEILAD